MPSTAPSYSLESYTAWVAFLDVYGFSAQVDTSKYQEAARRLAAAHEEIRGFLAREERHGVSEYFAFSDSLFLVYRDQEGRRDRSLATCVDDVCQILHAFAQHGLPLRGGISHGEISVGEHLLLGEPVLRAVSYERQIVVPAVLLPDRELTEALSARLTPASELLEIRGGGLVRGRALLPYRLAEFAKVVDAQLHDYARNGPPEVAAAWKKVKDLVDRVAV